MVNSNHFNLLFLNIYIMSLKSLDKKKIETALANTSGSNPNLFISIHACAPDYLPEDFEKYYNIKDIVGSFSATVP